MRFALLGLVLLAGCSPASGEPRSDEAPLVIELFTSQGCSSCPAAERLLDKLARTGTVAGRPIAPLAFHVDYWDDLGWKDPFASPAWTERQRQYADALDDRIYTPELVVAGRVGVVGSNATSVLRAIANAPAQHKLDAHATWSATSLVVEATAPAGADVIVAVWQDGTKTNVPRGENAGATLTGDRIVRRLERVATAGTRGTKTITIDRSMSGAVVFAQRTDRKIVGATLLSRP
jgi:hypothetical protein